MRASCLHDALPNKIIIGHIAVIGAATGATMSLLPPDNASGNFIKIVQRLPVRIGLEGYDPDKKPLFIGASVGLWAVLLPVMVGRSW